MPLTHPSPSNLSRDSSDIANPLIRRARFFAQDKRLLDAVVALATTVKACPPEPGYPDHEPSALIVGGFVRDALAGRFPKDADMEIYGVSPERLESLLDQLYPGRVNKVGKAFGIFKVALEPELDLDVSIPRRESKVAPGHTGFEVTGDPTMSVQEAARRRDFTINSIAVDPLTGVYHDPFHGIEDIQTKTLRITNEERFQDDPLRVYRAMQFVARMELQVEEQTMRLMKEMVARGDLAQLKNERITEEWKKLLLTSAHPSLGLNLAKDLGILKKSYPELEAIDRWETMTAYADHAARALHAQKNALPENDQMQIMLAALCVPIDSIEKAQTLLGRWSFSKKDVNTPTILLIKGWAEPSRIWTRHHKQELRIAQTANEIRKVLKRIYPVTLDTLLTFNEILMHGTIDTGSARTLFQEHVAIHPVWLDPKRAGLVSGTDLQSCGVPPGPEMGKMIRVIEDLRDRGEIATREEALKWLLAHKRT